jgi:F-type H+-transporting ATPase subunit b
MPQITQLSMVFASQLFWLTLVFGIIFFGIGRAMLPKIRSTIKARDSRVADDLERAQAARSAAEGTEAAWRERMDESRADAARIAQAARQESAREAEVRIKAALDEIDAKVDQARLRIRSAVEGARAELEATAVEAAQEMVEKLTGLKIDRRDAANAVAQELAAIDRIDQPRARPVEQPRVAAGGG